VIASAGESPSAAGKAARSKLRAARRKLLGTPPAKQVAANKAAVRRKPAA
jgi:hypothetical protein